MEKYKYTLTVKLEVEIEIEIPEKVDTNVYVQDNFITDEMLSKLVQIGSYAVKDYSLETMPKDMDSIEAHLVGVRKFK